MALCYLLVLTVPHAQAGPGQRRISPGGLILPMLKRIAVAELRIGMYIHELCGSWMDHPFWRSSFMLKSAHDLDQIRSSEVTEAWIDISKGIDVAPGKPSSTAQEVEAQAQASLQAVQTTTPPPVRVSYASELRRARKLCMRSRDAVVDMFNNARMGKAIETEGVNELVGEIYESVVRNSHALITLARLKHADEYTYMHSIAVCALMIALARELALPEEMIREAGVAGLLHDIGKMSIPEHILNKPGRLTDTEFERVRQHPAAGNALLRDAGPLSPLVLDVCLHHHEKFDGSGYPSRLVGEEISLLSRMAAVCDVYDAITSNRPYKSGWDPAESIRKMAEWTGHFDTRIFHAFVKTVGIYPIGALVRLSSGRLGVVVEQNENSLLTPRVKVFFSARSRMPLAKEVVDLAKLDGEKIVGRECAAEWGFRNLEELWLDTEALQPA